MHGLLRPRTYALPARIPFRFAVAGREKIGKLDRPPPSPPPPFDRTQLSPATYRRT